MNYNTQLSTLFALLLTLVSLPALAVDRYVAPNGSDTAGIGAINAPYATALGAYSHAFPGDRIVFRAGIYPTHLRVSKAGLTFMSAPGEQAVLQFPAADSPPGPDMILWLLAPNCQVLNLTLDGQYTGQAYYCHYCVKAEGTLGQGAVISGCTLKNSADALIKGAAPVNAATSANPGMTLTVRQCNLYKDPSTPMLRSTWTAIDSLMNGTVVDHCSIHDMPGNSAISFKGGVTGCQATNNTITNMGNGIWLGAYDGGYVYNVNGSNPLMYSCIGPLCKGNTITNCKNAGIVLMGALNASVTGNTVRQCGHLSQAALLLQPDSYWSTTNSTRGLNTNPTIAGNTFDVATGIYAAGSYVWQRPCVYITGGGLDLAAKGSWQGNTYSVTVVSPAPVDANGKPIPVAPQFWNHCAQPVLASGSLSVTNFAKWLATLGPEQERKSMALAPKPAGTPAPGGVSR